MLKLMKCLILLLPVATISWLRNKCVASLLIIVVQLYHRLVVEAIIILLAQSPKDALTF